MPKNAQKPKSITPLFLPLFATFLAACGASSTSNQAPGTSLLTMKVNGVAWEAKGKVSGVVSSTLIGLSGDLDAKGSENLTVNIYTPKPGTYVIDKAARDKDGSVVQFFNQNTIFTSDISTSSFTVVVTKASGFEVEGTFSGSYESAAGSTGPLAQRIVITEGKFVTR